MPGAAYAYALIALAVMALVVLLLARRRSVERQLVQGALERLRAIESEAARKREAWIAREAAKVRSETGPEVPKL